MSIITGKRNHGGFRSGGAGPGVPTAKRPPIHGQNPGVYKYKAPPSHFFLCSKQNEYPTRIGFMNGGPHQSKGGLRKPLINIIGGKEFLQTLNATLYPFSNSDPPKTEKTKNLGALLLGTLGDLGCANIATALGGGCKGFAQLGGGFNVSRQEIKRISMRLGGGDQPKPPITKKPKKLGGGHLGFLSGLMGGRANCFLALTQIKGGLLAKFNLGGDFVSIHATHGALGRLGFSPKKASKSPTKRGGGGTGETRKIIARQLLDCMQKDTEIVFVGGMGFNQNLAPPHGHPKKKGGCHITAPPKSNNPPVIAAMTIEGLIAFQIIKGSVGGGGPCGFFANLLNYLGSGGGGNYVYLMDNASIHKSKIFQNLVKKDNAIPHNAPYSPMMNCIEGVFSKWEHKFRKLLPQNEQDLLQKIILSSQTITQEDCRGYYKHLLKMMRASFMCEDIY